MNDEEFEQYDSRSARKRAAAEVTDLARKLASLSAADAQRLPLGPELRKELELVRKTKGFGARDRQVRHFAGVLRRREEELEEVRRFLLDLEGGRQSETAQFHQLEIWREKLCDPEQFSEALEEVLRASPGLDRNELAKRARAARSGDKRASRELFRYLRRGVQDLS